MNCTKIFHFLQFYTPAIGGGVKFVRETGMRLVGKGHSVTVGTSTALENAGLIDSRRWALNRYTGERVTKEDGISVHRYDPKFMPALGHIPLVRYGPVIPRSLWDKAIYESDVLHTSAFPYAHNVLACLASRIARKPLCVTPYYKPGLPISVELRKVLSYANRILVPVPWEAREIHRRYGIAASRIDIVPSGVDQRVFRPARAETPERYLLYVGRLTEVKGVRHLIQAFLEHLLPQERDLRLMIVGPVSEWARNNLPRHRTVIMKGAIRDEPTLALLYQNCQAVCYPSRDDCFPHVFLEAWSCQKPVVGCRIGGVADVIEDGVDGLFAAYGDPHDLSDKLSELLQNPGWARRMGTRGRRKVLARYTWEEVTRSLEVSYEKALRA